VVPDMLGYGQSDKPHEREEYSLRRISNDLASILDAIRVRKAVSPNRTRPEKLWVMAGFLDRDWARLGVAHRVEVRAVAPGESPWGGPVSGWFCR